MVGNYPLEGALKLTVDGATDVLLVKDYLKVSSDETSSDGLAVFLSGLKCHSKARMTDSLEFSIDKTQCSPVESEGCTYSTLLERGKGSKSEDYAELDIEFSGTLFVHCTDGSMAQMELSLSMSGFRIAEDSAVGKVPERRSLPESLGREVHLKGGRLLIR